MKRVQLILEDSYKGYGHSQGLARGLQLFCDGKNMTQEGMGLGTIAIKEDNCTYFSQKCENIQKEEGILWRRFALDTILLTGPMGIETSFLTRIRDRGMEFYKKHPKTQKVQLSADRFLRKLFRIRRRFKEIKPKAEAIMSYHTVDSGVCITFDISIQGFRLPKICLMNELGADWFDESQFEGEIKAPPSAWQLISAEICDHQMQSFYSEKLGLCFSIGSIDIADNLPYELYWGREKTQELCWAGYTIEIEVKDPTIKRVTGSYKVVLTQQREYGANGHIDEIR